MYCSYYFIKEDGLMIVKNRGIKKVVSLFLCFALVFGSSFLSFAADNEQTEEFELGDVDGNGQITAEDAAMVLAYITSSGRFELTDEQLSRARVDGNKDITYNDASRILQKVLDDNAIEFTPWESEEDSSDTTETQTNSEETQKPVEDESSSEDASTPEDESSSEDASNPEDETSSEDASNPEDETNSEDASTPEDEPGSEDASTPEDESSSEDASTPEESESTSDSEESTEETTKLIVSLSADDFENTMEITTDTPIGGEDGKFFTIKALGITSANVSVAEVKNGIEYGDKNYTKVIKLNGTGKTDSNGTYRKIEFKVDSDSTIKVVARNTSTTAERKLVLDDGTSKPEEVCPTTIGEVTFTYETTEEKTLSLYSASGGLEIYQVDVYKGIAGSQTPEPEPPVETTTKAPSSTLGITGSVEAGEYTQNTTVGNFNVLADNTNKVSVVADNVTLGDNTYNKALQLSSNGSKTAGALSFNVDGPAKIAVIAKGVCSINMSDSTGDITGTVTADDNTNAKRYMFDTLIPNAGTTISLFASGLSAGQNVNIYSVEVYNESPNAKFSHTGFGDGNVTGGGTDVSESDTTAYVKVKDEAGFIAAVKNKKCKVIEITANELNLGSKELTEISSDLVDNNIVKAAAEAKNNQTLIDSGVSQISIQDRSGLTIFSKNGAKIKHTCLVVKRCNNIIIRNIEFDELWEWDEGGTDSSGKVQEPGAYDLNDWDYITFDNTFNAWVDHCTFHKAYDGIIDIKNGSSDKDASHNVAISWCKFLGDDQTDNSWVTRQINQLETKYQEEETAGVTTYTYPLYSYLRKTQGLTPKQIIAVQAPQKKAHLVGHTNDKSKDPKMGELSVTIYNCYYKDIQDRMPRLRGGNAHIFNTIIDSDNIYATKNNKDISDKFLNGATNKKFHFGLTNQALLSTCGGALKAENLYMKGVVSPMSYEQDENYPGKLLAEHIKYYLNDSKKYEDINSTDNNEDFKPTGKESTMEKFSWNTTNEYIKNGELSYDYELIPLNELENEIKPETTGAGVITSADWNWLATEY